MITEDYKEKYEGLKKKTETLHKMASETSHDNTRMAIEELFPELKESEDERMRKHIIRILQQIVPDHETYHNEIAWLEKQGEQKPTDKVEPKFKVGDFIINEYGFIMQIDGIDGNMYVYHVLDDNRILKHNITKADESCHLWTIKDAKDGEYFGAGFSTEEPSFRELSMPLMEYLRKNYHPHARIIIEYDGAEIVEGMLCEPYDNNTK